MARAPNPLNLKVYDNFTHRRTNMRYHGAETLTCTGLARVAHTGDVGQQTL